MNKADGRIHRVQEKIQAKRQLIQKYSAQKEFYTAEIIRIQGELKQLENDLAQLSKKSTSMKISDHGLVRWLERAKGIDMDMFRDELLKTLPNYLPDGEHTLQGIKMIVKDNTIITIMTGNEIPLHQK